MICPRCGTINPEGAERCSRCQGSLAPPPPREEIDRAAEAVAGAAVVAGPPQEANEGPEGRDAIPPVPPAETPTWPPPWPPPSRPGAPGPPQEWPSPPATAESSTHWPSPPATAESSAHWPPPAPPSPPSGAVPNYMVWAVVCTFVFNPIGILAIVYCIVANRRLATGDIDRAMRAAHLAKTWCWVSVIVFMVVVLLLASHLIGLTPPGR